MKFEKKELQDHRVELLAEVSSEQFENAKQKAAKKLSKTTKIPGFRPGKAPYDIIKRTFGEETIEEAAIDLLIDEIYPKLIKETGIKPYGPGKLESVESKNPPKFRFSVPLEPEVILGDYTKIKQPYKPPRVEEDEIKKVLNNLQLNYATAEPVDRAAEKGDLVSIKITGVLLKPEKDHEAEILKETPHEVIIGEELGEEQFPFIGFGEKLIGLKAGDTKEVKHNYTKDSKYEELRGKEVKFFVVVESIKRLIKPNLDDEFAKMLGLPSFSELESSIRSQIELEKLREYDNQYYNELLDKIVKASVIKYPPQHLELEVEEVRKAIEADIEKENLDFDTYLKLIKREKDEFIENDIKPVARRRLEHNLILSEISRKENIELDKSELEQEFSRSFMQMQASPNFKTLQKEYTTTKLANMTVMQTAMRLMDRHALERLKTIASGGEGKESELKDSQDPHE